MVDTTLDMGRFTRTISLRVAAVVFITSCLASVQSAPQEDRKRPGVGQGRPYGDQSWDLLIFTQNWPRAVCDRWTERNGNTCFQYPSGIWTIHGIWPTKLGTTGPGSCDRSKPYRAQDTYAIENQLDYFWAPIHQIGDKRSFWAHEWNKHGTCALSLPQMSSQLRYFSTAVEWAKKYNMYNVLKAAGISPGQRYSVNIIMSRLEDVLKKRSQVICYRDRQGNSVLLEVRTCFDKNLALAHCDGTSLGSNGKSLTNCRSDQPVLYPQ